MSGIAKARLLTNARRPSGPLSSVLENGIGRPVQQLKRLTLKFCEISDHSIQVRQFVEDHLINFAAKHPNVVVYALPETDALPQVCAEYLNGREEIHELKKKDCDDISNALDILTKRSGLELMRITRDYTTKYPSIQGQWHPFTHKKNYDISKSLHFSTKLYNAWDSVGNPWKSCYRKNELYKLGNRPKLTLEEKTNRPLGKWGPILPPKY